MVLKRRATIRPNRGIIREVFLFPERKRTTGFTYPVSTESAVKLFSGWPILQLEGKSPQVIVMKVNDSNLSSLGTSNLTGTQETSRSSRGSSNAAQAGSSDDVHFSELVRSLRSLAAESPERQARLEQLARAYASGTYHADPQATASKMVDDALES